MNNIEDRAALVQGDVTTQGYKVDINADGNVESQGLGS